MPFPSVSAGKASIGFIIASSSARHSSSVKLLWSPWPMVPPEATTVSPSPVMVRVAIMPAASWPAISQNNVYSPGWSSPSGRLTVPPEPKFGVRSPVSFTPRLWSIEPLLWTRSVTSPAGATRFPVIENSSRYTSIVDETGASPPPLPAAMATAVTAAIEAAMMNSAPRLNFKKKSIAARLSSDIRTPVVAIRSVLSMSGPDK